MLKKLPPFLVSLTLWSIPLSAFSFSVHLAISSKTAGHEEISRQAILMTKDIIEKEYGHIGSDLLIELGDMKKIFWGADAVLTDNPLIRGNYAADKPDQKEWLTKYDLNIREINKFPGIEKEKSMLSYGGARAFHFTKNECEQPDGSFKYQSAKEVCEEAKSRILTFSNVAMTALKEYFSLEVPEKGDSYFGGLIGFGSNGRLSFYWDDERKKAIAEKRLKLRKALFAMGVATHTIQDSFSPSHTFRSPVASGNARPEYQNYNVLDICYYDQKLEHIGDDLKEMVYNVVLKETQDDKGISVLTPDIRYQQYLEQKVPCDHGKMDKNDFVWLSTRVQAEILEANFENWRRWEDEIYRDIVKSDAWTNEAANENITAFCNNERRKESDWAAFKCLKHEARLARTATVKYLLAMYEHVLSIEDPTQIDSPQSLSNLEEKLDQEFFNGAKEGLTHHAMNEIMPQGVIVCDGLPSTVHVRRDNPDHGSANKNIFTTVKEEPYTCDK